MNILGFFIFKLLCVAYFVMPCLPNFILMTSKLLICTFKFRFSFGLCFDKKKLCRSKICTKKTLSIWTLEISSTLLFLCLFLSRNFWKDFWMWCEGKRGVGICCLFVLRFWLHFNMLFSFWLLHIYLRRVFRKLFFTKINSQIRLWTTLKFNWLLEKKLF